VTRPADDARRAIDASGIVAILRGDFLHRAALVVETLVGAGIRAIEVTLNAPHAEQLFAALQSSGQPQLVAGVGTVRTREDLARAIDWGAAFVVSPHLDEDIVATAVGSGLMAIPGAFTPTEILRAHAAGAQAIKLFPADSLGPRFVRAFRAPVPNLALVPTGGVTLELAKEFREAGAWAVGLGSPLVGSGPDTADGWQEALALRARAFAYVMRPASGPVRR
jgi:2-dehydro-3-deoxyphosphogluconate aldolase/(4S)-4-hydroxy-2-oxoglutarate aldolase